MSTQPTTPSAKVNIPEPPRPLIWLALLFVPGVYITLLLALAIVVAVGGGLAYLIINWIRESHHLNGRLIVLAGLLALGALYGIIAVIKGLIMCVWRRPPLEPAIIINFPRERDLGHFIAPLCTALNTRIPDTVILHAEPTFFVTQGKIHTFNGMAKGRILAIGLPLLAGLNKNELRAILCHEFAHFSGGDTLYSSCVLPVYAGASTAWAEMSQAMANTESLTQKLPMMVPRVMLYLYLCVFSLLDSHISRLRELRADAIAVATCGTDSFKYSLMKTAGLIGAFGDDKAPDIARQVTPDPKVAFHTAFRRAMPQLNDIANAHFRIALSEPENPHDTHPSLKRRLDSAPNVPERYSDKEPCASLLADLEQYEAKLSESYGALLALAREGQLRQ